MTIYEFSEIIDVALITTYNPTLKYFQTYFEKSEIKNDIDDLCLQGFWGKGKTVTESVIDYLNRIKGKILIINPMDQKRRREYKIPINLEEMNR